MGVKEALAQNGSASSNNGSACSNRSSMLLLGGEEGGAVGVGRCSSRSRGNSYNEMLMLALESVVCNRCI